MPIQDYCRTEATAVSPDVTLATAALGMRDAGVGGLVVVDAANRPVGVLTDRDVVIAALGRRLDPAKTLVRDVMRNPVVTVTAGAPIGVGIRFLRMHRLRRLPVIDKETGQLTGIFTADDAVQLLAEELSGIAELVRLQNPSPGGGKLAAPIAGRGRWNHAKFEPL